MNSNIPFTSVGAVPCSFPRYSFITLRILGSNASSVLGASNWLSILSAPSLMSWVSCLDKHNFLTLIHLGDQILLVLN